MRLHPVLRLVALLGLGSAAGLIGATFLAAPPVSDVEASSTSHGWRGQDTTAETLAPTQPDVEPGEREFATKLLTARQENAQRQFEGQPSVWMSMSVDLRDIPARSAEPETTKTRSPSAP